jgi:hypothetical protein
VVVVVAPRLPRPRPPSWSSSLSWLSAPSSSSSSSSSSSCLWLASLSWSLLAFVVLLRLGARRRLVASLSLLPFGRRRGGLGGSSPPLVLVLLVGGLRPAVARPSSFPRLSSASCCVAFVIVVVIMVMTLLYMLVCARVRVCVRVRASRSLAFVRPPASVNFMNYRLTSSSLSSSSPYLLFYGFIVAVVIVVCRSSLGSVSVRPHAVVVVSSSLSLSLGSLSLPRTSWT